jgi:hypothetical protein
VAIRVRPLNAREAAHGTAWSSDETAISQLNPETGRPTGNTYTFGTRIPAESPFGGHKRAEKLTTTSFTNTFFSALYWHFQDRVYGQNEGSEDIYANTASDIIKSALAGVNGTTCFNIPLKLQGPIVRPLWSNQSQYLMI